MTTHYTKHAFDLAFFFWGGGGVYVVMELICL